jgi:hypothetical protein
VCMYASIILLYHYLLAFQCQVVASGRKDVAERAGQLFSGTSKFVHFLLMFYSWSLSRMLSCCNDADFLSYLIFAGLEKTIYFVEGELGSSRLLSFF